MELRSCRGAQIAVIWRLVVRMTVQNCGFGRWKQDNYGPNCRTPRKTLSLHVPGIRMEDVLLLVDRVASFIYV